LRGVDIAGLARVRNCLPALDLVTKLAGRLQAMPLDPVYSGKGLAGLMALLRTGRWRRHDHIVFIHTGGAPALFGYREVLSF